MASLTVLQTRLDDLRALRAKGILKVEYEGKLVQYRSDAELADAIHDLERQIAGASSSRPPVKVTYFR